MRAASVRARHCPRLPLLRSSRLMTSSSARAGAAPDAPIDVRATRLVFAEVVVGSLLVWTIPIASNLSTRFLQGEQAMRGRPISAGPLLKIVDGFAASVGDNIIDRSMVMAACERLDVSARIFHGDLVRFEGQLLYTGRSSVTVQVTGHRRGIRDRAYERALSAVMTLVAIDKSGRAATSGVPKLVDPRDSAFADRMEKWAADRKALGARWTKAQLEVDAMPRVSRDMLETGGDGVDAVTVGESRVELSAGFMPNQLNANGTVYGGELLRWMDNTAVFCAQSFAQNENAVTVSANRVAFRVPVTLEDFLTLSARVTRVSGARMEVAVDVFLKTVRSPEVKTSHTGYFTIANLDANNAEVPIRRQLRADADDHPGLRDMLKAQRRAEMASDEAALFALEPLDVSVGLGAVHQGSKL